MRALSVVVVSLLLLFPSTSFAGPIRDAVNAVGDTASAVGKSIGDTVDTVTGDRTPAMVRGEVDLAEKKALSKLFSQQPQAKALFEKSYGYAVFDSSKKGLMISSASGVGVAVERAKASRTYMRMTSLGANVGGGVSYYYVVFLFENSSSFQSFVNDGWEAGGAADAVFGKDAVAADIRFVNGKAIFQLNNTGIMLGANISGTKYWKDSALNGKG